MSPSGTGLRLLGFGFKPDGGNRADVDGAEGHVELYDTGRYLTVTGHKVADAADGGRDLHRQLGTIVDQDAERNRILYDILDELEGGGSGGDGDFRLPRLPNLGNLGGLGAALGAVGLAGAGAGLASLQLEAPDIDPIPVDAPASIPLSIPGGVAATLGNAIDAAVNATTPASAPASVTVT